MNIKSWFGLALLCAGFVGCAEQQPPVQGGGGPKLPDPGATGEYSIDWPELGRGEARYIVVDMGPDTLETCRRVSPKFPFDSAKTRAQDNAQLSAFASCLNHDSMKDKKVLLIGRADAQGADTYNKDLGAKRAAHIRELLIKGGLDASRIEVDTEGETGAVGHTPDYSPGYDRRVDVIVKGGAHAP